MHAPEECFVPLRATATSKAAAAKCTDDTRVIRPSVVNSSGTDDSVATDGPHRPTVGSRPWTSPAKERAVALTAQYFRRRLRHDRPQHRYTNRWQHTLASTTEEVQQGGTESTKQNYPFTCRYSRQQPSSDFTASRPTKRTGKKKTSLGNPRVLGGSFLA